MSIIKFTLVSTVFNEADRIENSIDDLNKQTVSPDEIIITDAGSTDGTYEKLLAWKEGSLIPIKILQKDRCNVAEGRNMAIRAASHDLIVSTDFGCRFDSDWLKNLTMRFEDPKVQVVGGAFGVTESDQNTLAAKAAYILAEGYETDVHAEWFIPSSRSIAYYKEVFDSVGGYCEWLTLAADDSLFGKRIRERGYKIFKSDHVGVFWGRHTTDTGYIKEAFRYGLGDGEARINTRNFVSNSIETILRYLLFITFPAILIFVISGQLSPLWILVCVPLLPGLRSYKKYLSSWLKLKSEKYDFKVFLYGFNLMERIKQQYIKGYLKGYLRRKNIPANSFA